MISVCMIVKDEEDIIEDTLRSIVSYNFEIILVDTGSKDKTKEIARKYTNNIFDYKWNDNFSDARNYSISKATNDFILVIDADERIIGIDLDKLNELIINNSNKIGRLLRINEYFRNGEKYKFKERVNRLFHKNYYKYEGSIHEQIISCNSEDYIDYNIPILISHIGYEESEVSRKNKLERNIDLLNKEISKKADPYILFQLGKSYYMKKDFNKANYYFNETLNYDLNPKLEYVQDLIETYGYSLINNEEYEEALKLINVYDEFAISADFIFLIGLILMNNGYFEEAINEFEKAKTYKSSKMEGINTYLANYNIGVILECINRKSEAVKYYKMCEGYEKAKERLIDIDK